MLALNDMGYKLADNQQELTPLQKEFLLLGGMRLKAIKSGRLKINDSIDKLFEKEEKTGEIDAKDEMRKKYIERMKVRG